MSAGVRRPEDDYPYRRTRKTGGVSNLDTIGCAPALSLVCVMQFVGACPADCHSQQAASSSASFPLAILIKTAQLQAELMSLVIISVLSFCEHSRLSCGCMLRFASCSHMLRCLNFSVYKKNRCEYRNGKNLFFCTKKAARFRERLSAFLFMGVLYDFQCIITHLFCQLLHNLLYNSCVVGFRKFALFRFFPFFAPPPLAGRPPDMAA